MFSRAESLRILSSADLRPGAMTRLRESWAEAECIAAQYEAYIRPKKLALERWDHVAEFIDECPS